MKGVARKSIKVVLTLSLLVPESCLFAMNEARIPLLDTPPASVNGSPDERVNGHNAIDSVAVDIALAARLAAAGGARSGSDADNFDRPGLEDCEEDATRAAAPDCCYVEMTDAADGALPVTPKAGVAPVQSASQAQSAPTDPQKIVAAINESGEGLAEYDPEDQTIAVQPKPGFCARHCACLKPFFEAIRQRWAMLPAGVKEGILVGLPVVGNAMINFATGNAGKAEGAPLAFGLGFGPFIAEVCQPYSIWIKIPVGAVAGILDYIINSFGLYGTELPYGLCYLLAAVFVGWTAANIVKDPEGIDAQQLRAYGRLPLSVQRETAHKFVADAKTVCNEYRYRNFGSESV